MTGYQLNKVGAGNDSESEIEGRKLVGGDEDFFDFQFHDFRKTYLEPTREYLKYHEQEKFKAAEE